MGETPLLDVWCDLWILLSGHLWWEEIIDLVWGKVLIVSFDNMMGSISKRMLVIFTIKVYTFVRYATHYYFLFMIYYVYLYIYVEWNYLEKKSKSLNEICTA